MFALICLASSALYAVHEEKQFLSWMRSTNQLFTGDEYHLRFGIFMTNARFVREFHSDSFKISLNKFAALTPSEYKALLGYVPVEQHAKNYVATKSGFKTPESLDWREKGAVSEVKDQGHCGSCWAFSTICGAESAHVVQSQEKLTRLSEQCLVDCVTTCHGCEGGLMTTAISYIQKVYKGKVSLEADYPYKAVQEACKYDESKGVGHVTGFINIRDYNEDDLCEKCAQYGPVCVAIDASNELFRLYTGGIYDDWHCSQQVLNHGIACVGFGEENGIKYTILRNSWGADWGEGGYLRLKRGVNLCGVATIACSVTVA